MVTINTDQLKTGLLDLENDSLRSIKTERSTVTCSKVEDNVTEKYRVRDNVENNSTHWQIVIEKGDCDRKYDEVSDEK